VASPSPGKKIYTKEKIKYNHGKVSDAIRPPLLALDPDTISNKKHRWPSGSKNQIQSRNRVLKKKEEKYMKESKRLDYRLFEDNVVENPVLIELERKKLEIAIYRGSD
jgi:hypothetical protein